jgi:hypothetical protein
MFTDRPGFLKRESSFFAYFIHKSASFANDSFFFISGISLCKIFYNFSRKLNIHSWNVSHQFHLFGYIIVYKLVCLVGQYAVILELLNIFMKHFHENSILSVPTSDHVSCDNNIWRKLLFVDIFVSPEQRVSFTFFMRRKSLKEIIIRLTRGYIQYLCN